MVIETPQDWSDPYSNPSYLPNADWLIFDRFNEINMVRTDGTDFRQVIPNATNQIVNPAPSPSGSSIAFAVRCDRGFSIRSATTSAVTDACWSASQVHFPGRNPAWGPEQIAFESDEANSDIFVVAPTGGTAFNLTAHPADDRNPAWAPAQTVIP
jgi:hypothetical protein